MATGDEREEHAMNVEGHCPACGSVVRVPLPVPPLFNREEVCVLIPIKLTSLRHWLYRHRGDPRLSPPRYAGPVRRAKRMFTADDVRLIRSLFVRDHQ